MSNSSSLRIFDTIELGLDCLLSEPQDHLTQEDPAGSHANNESRIIAERKNHLLATDTDFDQKTLAPRTLDRTPAYQDI